MKCKVHINCWSGRIGFVKQGKTLEMIPFWDIFSCWLKEIHVFRVSMMSCSRPKWSILNGVWLSSPVKVILLDYLWNWNKWSAGRVLEKIVLSLRLGWWGRIPCRIQSFWEYTCKIQIQMSSGYCPCEKNYSRAFCSLKKLCFAPQWRVSWVSLQLVIVSVVDAGGSTGVPL